MKIWNRLFNKLSEPGLDDELDFHRALKQREFEAQGMRPREASDAARRAMGNVTLAREDSRAEWSFTWLNDLGRDLRYAFRSLRAQPGFTIAAVLALVLGIGVNAILFNIYNALALTPWSVRDAGSVVRVFQGEHNQWGGFSWPAFRYLRDHSRSKVTAYDTNILQMTRKEVTWKANVVEADETFFDVLGTGFAAGRGFSPSNGNLRDPAPEIVLQYTEWTRHFNADRSVIGEWIELNGRRLQIVGVAAEGFGGPVPVSPNLWVPAPWHDIFHPGNASTDKPDNCCSKVVARLEQGNPNQAQAELDTLLAQFNTDLKRDPSHVLLTKLTLLAEPRTRNQATPAFLAMCIASLLILVLACANVANLQLARGVSRWREFAVRASLGASRGRILRQLLVEALLLSAIAGTLTALVSQWAPSAIMNAIGSATNANGELNFSFSNDWRVILAATGLSLVAALLFGLLPSWTTARGTVSAGLQQGGRSTGASRVRTVLLGVQVVLCTVLLSGAMLLVRALNEAQHADVGFAASKLIVLNPNLDSSGAPEIQTKAINAALIDRLKTLPQVEMVAHAVVVPLGSRNDSVNIDIPGTKQQIVFAHNRVSANFFDAMGVRMVSGRAFTDADQKRADSMIINESLAKRAWPDSNPIGKELLDRRIVVGVVRDFAIKEIGPAGEPGAFIPSEPSRDSQLLIRGPKALADPAVRLARGMDKFLSMASAESYDSIVDRSRITTILVAAVASVLSGLALVLACVGIYGVAAYSVSQRTREIGVRMALGARRPAIVQMVLKENLRVVLAGGVIGLGGAFLFGRLLTSMLYGVKPGDPLALVATVAILLATAGAAAWLPARRAAAVDPAITLRHD